MRQDAPNAAILTPAIDGFFGLAGELLQAVEVLVPVLADTLKEAA